MKSEDLDFKQRIPSAYYNSNMIRKKLTCRPGELQAFPLSTDFRYIITSMIGTNVLMQGVKPSLF